MSASRRPGRGTQSGVEVRHKRPKCPICGKPAALDYRPFCSKQCADIDLGRWLGGSYAVPGEKVGAKPLGGEGTAEGEDED